MRRAAWLGLALACSACVTTSHAPADEAALARTIVVPLPAAVIPTEAPLLAFYQGLLERLHAAWQDGRLDELRQLLRGYRRDDAPDWARSSMDSFVTAALGLEFEQHCRRRAGLGRTGDAEPGLGQALGFVLQLPPCSGREVVLGDDAGGPLRFGVRFAIEDTLLDGSRRRQTVTDQLPLTRRTTLVDGGPPLQLPFELGAERSEAVRRRLSLSIWLLPGFVLVDGERAPVRHTLLASAEVCQYPAGSEPIRQQPLATLRAAQARGDQAHFPHVLLAAMFAAPADARPMQELLIGWVRNGRDQQPVVAMAALRELTGADIAVGDRQGWLQWWQQGR